MFCKYYDPMYVEAYMTPTGLCCNPKCSETYCYGGYGCEYMEEGELEDLE